MKRNCQKIIPDESECSSPVSKKFKEDESNVNTLQLTNTRNDPEASEQMLLDVFKEFVGSRKHTFVERETTPLGHSLVNSAYVGKMTYQEPMDLDANVSHASQFVIANMGNRVDQIGRNMKNMIHDSLQEVFQNTLRDSELHMTACNFVKKPGQTYHLYERPSGQKYFSMLSLEDWSGNAPHRFLGSWYLECDQSWTSAAERHLRFEGISFIKNVLGAKSIQ